MSGQPVNPLWAYMQEQQQAFNPITYVPASRMDSIRGKTITKIHIAARESKPSESVDVQHWVFYLQTGDRSSVRLDIQPSYTVPAEHEPNGSKANLVISELDYAISRNVVQSVSLEPQRNDITVDALIRLLESTGRQKYEFTSQGTGCRRWINDTVQLMADTGVVLHTAAEPAKQCIERLWPQNQPSPIPHGGMYY
jgi:hypothetical protein